MLLLILEKEWGAWKYDKAEGRVVLDSDSAATEFNNATKRIGYLKQRIEKLQYTLLTHQAGE